MLKGGRERVFESTSDSFDKVDQKIFFVYIILGNSIRQGPNSEFYRRFNL